MVYEWKQVPIIDCIELIGGGTPKTSVAEYWDGDIPWLSVKDFNNDYRYVYTTEKHITKAGLDNSSTKLLQKDDIIISARGTVGEMAMIPFPMAFNQSCYGIRAKNGFNSTFIYYLLKNSIAKLKLMTHGSVFDTITRDTFATLLVDIPDKSTQDNIAATLAAIDDKIDLNNKINDNLQQLCLLHYRNLSYQNTPNGCIGDIIIESPKSKIKVGDAKGISGAYPFFTSGQAILEYESNLVDGRNIYLNTGGNADVKYYIGPASYSTDTWCIHGTDKLTDYLYLALLDIKDEIDQTCFEGSTLKHLQKQKLRDKSIYIPSKEDEPILVTIKANLDLISHNQRENKKLANLRDALLPKLISGTLDVSNIDI